MDGIQPYEEYEGVSYDSIGINLDRLALVTDEDDPDVLFEGSDGMSGEIYCKEGHIVRYEHMSGDMRWISIHDRSEVPIQAVLRHYTEITEFELKHISSKIKPQLNNGQ